MHPEPGKSGPFRLTMYRGSKLSSERLHDDFASDPGDYGVGEYWTDSKKFAEFYGEVEAQLIELENVYHISKPELRKLIEEYRTCKMEDGHEKRRENSLRLTQVLKAQGYEAALTVGYEDFTSMGLCIFDA